MLRPEFSELKKIKVDFGFGLCIDGKSLSRHKQRFYILASALIEHFLGGIGKNHILIFFPTHTLTIIKNLPVGQMEASLRNYILVGAGDPVRHGSYISIYL